MTPPHDSYSPPLADTHGFLDHILNPAGVDHGRYAPFADMPPTTRARPHGSERPARLPNGYVDLTSAPESPPHSSHTRKRPSPTPGPSAKRQKRQHDTAAESDGNGAGADAMVDELDLTGDKPSVQQVLQKQREDAVKAQAKPEETMTTFNTFNCVICMDNPTDLTATACGTSCALGLACTAY
ncbi:hypothetical protein BDW02DRAFT_572023 [Decorospora gaudefroyi]|uniref:Uncharacterized protein n=1 Tax=Decorospora gaudefroyi TaxID=184978 RepID=A0A6A5K9M6_9PLEO|nr:hypothetical protein BDW02DRAFT_572023 [Decorospora gaudefroyi]